MAASRQRRPPEGVSVQAMLLLANSPRAPHTPERGTRTALPGGKTVSLKPQPIGPVPEETARVARAAFPKGNAFMRMRDELGVLWKDEDFAGLFPRRGQPAMAPWRLALVTVMQFAEDLPDRRAADAVREARC